MEGGKTLESLPARPKIIESAQFDGDAAVYSSLYAAHHIGASQPLRDWCARRTAHEELTCTRRRISIEIRVSVGGDRLTHVSGILFRRSTGVFTHRPAGRLSIFCPTTPWYCSKWTPPKGAPNQEKPMSEKNGHFFLSAIRHHIGPA